ncbi:hypothetical protein HAX54_023671 [Datura stramonium]|uniref:Protein kinase domain-containing protein n=1 Tax=Datura stramonium TaxID=4076 RepID=A0ABS8UZ22_DATST|nr:hypothetical protein [Datura stramonium]
MLSSWSNFDNKTEGFVCQFRGVDCWNPYENRSYRHYLPGAIPADIANCPFLNVLKLDNNNLEVYKALVPNGWTVAIKRLQCTEDLEEEFVSEITTPGSLRHPNLVSLIGFCSERDERLLVYKYMPNGNLHEWLHSTEDKARLLDFPLRVKIAVGVARALSWLHHVQQ